MPKIKHTDIDEHEEHSESVWARVDAVVTLILENERYLHSKRTGELAKMVADKLKLSERSALRYIKLAKTEVRRIGRKQKEKSFVRAIRDREFLLAQTKNGTQKDYKLALEIMKDRDKILGLYVDEVKHSGSINLKNVNLSNLTDDQLTKLKNLLRNGIEIKEALLQVGVIIGN